jgi:3-isopropylmalate/(R)-2-methylmalate dehydratase small subunit
MLRAAEVDALFRIVRANSGYAARIDLAAQTVTTSDGMVCGFGIDAFRRECLLRNLDDIELTLRHAADIRAYELARAADEPWIFDGH